MARTRDIRTNQSNAACDVCGRTLLRGEHAESFLTGGERRTVCELCTVRAAQEGWIRESGGDDLGVSGAAGDRRGRGLIGRMRTRRTVREEAELAVAQEQMDELDPQIAAELVEGEHPVVAGPRRVQAQPSRSAARRRVEKESQARFEAPREDRQVHAVPTNAELKMHRALELFNGSEHPRTVLGVARSLGPPAVAVRPLPERPSVVGISVMWELSWYRFEVDLSDEAGGVLRVGQGYELADLPTEHRSTVNAAATDRGALELAVPAPAAVDTGAQG